MSQIENHLKWCLNDPKRLKKIVPDEEIPDKHMKKSEYNVKVMQALEKLGYTDWALNVGFYAIYHCFLAILAKYGYESRNQSCTITVLNKLIEDKKLDFNKDLISQFDTLEADKAAESSTIREKRELSTYGVETTIDTKQLDLVKDLIKKVQKETIKVLAD